MQHDRKGTDTYTFEDVIRVLNSVQPYDWRSFFDHLLQGHAVQAPLAGLARAGYRLVYDTHESQYMASLQTEKGTVDLTFSAGLVLDSTATIVEVLRDGPAFKAGLATGSQLMAVDGEAYSAQVLNDALERATHSDMPIELLIKTGSRYRTLQLDYHDGLRYPHLQSSGASAVHLEDVLAPRP